VARKEQVAQHQLVRQRNAGLHLPYAGVDVSVAVGAGDRDAVMTIDDKVQRSDPVDVDWRNRAPAPACRRDALPSAPKEPARPERLLTALPGRLSDEDSDRYWPCLGLVYPAATPTPIPSG
jgi:hypothetical protein